MIRRRHSADAEAFHEAWEGLSPASPEIAELIDAAEQLCAQAAVIEPAADFTTDFRAVLMAEAKETLVYQPVAPPVTRPKSTASVRQSAPSAPRRKLAGVAVAAVAAFGTIGLVSTSASALPGDSLYTVKRSVEKIELTVRTSPESKAKYQLQRAATRLAEAKELSASGSPADRAAVGSVLADFSEQSKAGSDALLSAPASDSNESLVVVNKFAERAVNTLDEISQSAPKEAQEPLRNATSVVSSIVNQVSERCSDCVRIDVGRLVSTVLPETKPTKSSGDAPANSGDPAVAVQPPASTGNPATNQGSSPSTPAKPSGQTPSAPPAAPATKPVVKDPVSTLVGSLLGDKEQTGLVPGLLNGLLGGK